MAPTHHPANTTPQPSAKGTLYLVPTPLDFGCHPDQCGPITDTLPARTLAIAAGLTHWITENAKSTRAFLKRVNEVAPLSTPLQAMAMTELPREIHKKGDHHAAHSSGDAVRGWLAPALDGQHVGLVSEAGMPAIADPGSSVVRAAHSLGIRVEVLVGPISLAMALAGSGLNGQNFAFVGYLPQDSQARVARLRELEQLAQRTGQTQLFIETPYRNAAMLQAATSALQPGTWLAVSSGLTLADTPGHCPPRHRSAPVAQWRKTVHGLDLSLPAVFMIGA
jgi:16S rRNA (cytidine1402-2'-O)-methyltransferase